MSDRIEKNEDDSEGFDFIREKIKEKPINKKKILIGLCVNLIFAIVFGIAACASFVLAKPYFNKVFTKNENPTINIPEDDQVVAVEEETPDQVIQEEPAEPEQVVVTKPVELSDYLNLESEIYDIGREANKSIVTVIAQSSELDLLNSSFANESITSGLIISADQELVILTEKTVVQGIDSIFVTFSNGQNAKASIRKMDANTGIAVLTVPLGEVPEEAKETYKAATLGNSYVIRQGTPILALGSFSGYSDAIARGNVTASTGMIATTDVDFTVLSTDIVGTGQAGGVLINLQGEVIGLFLKEHSGSDGQSTIAAISISELKGIIERLSNDQDIPHLGLELNTVTDAAADQYSLPMGVYVLDIITDSPAMTSGIQRGDVIIKFNDKDIVTTNDYEEALFDCSLEEEVKITVKRSSGESGYENIECNATVNVLK